METNNRTKEMAIKIAIIIGALAIIAGAIYLAINLVNKKVSDSSTASSEQATDSSQEEKKEEEKKIQIVSGNERPVAVMIDNVKAAWPHYGLQDAYIVYEIIVEGNETRLMALFQGKDTSKVGPVRSSRHYYLDYVMENDAIYTHYGWSLKAKNNIPKLGINNLNGVAAEGDVFWRSKNKKAPHNALTSMEKIKARAQKKGYRLTSNNYKILNYQVEEINLEDEEQDAKKVKIQTTSSRTTSYQYDEENKVYKRFMNGTAHKDAVTGKQYTAKNIIVYNVKNSLLTEEPFNEGKGCQELYNVGNGEGYYITNGKAMKIKWSKKSRQSKTIYTDLEGNELKVNDGNTYIQIIPTNCKVTFN